MKRVVLVIVLVAACKKKAPVVDEPKPAPISVDASVDAAAAGLPADFPKPEAAPASGKLVDKSFTVAKVVLRTRTDGSSLDLYAWSEGEPCEPQLAPEPHHLYVSVAFPAARLVVGTPIASGDERVYATYKKPDLGAVNESSWTVFDEITADRAKGRILLTGPDGTRVAGSFDATVCAGAQKSLAEPAPIHGLKWGTRDVEPAAIPKQPVRGVLLGKAGAPVAVEIVDWKDVAEQHEIHFYFTEPRARCQFDQLSPGFKVGMPASFKAGQTANQELTPRAITPFAAVVWQEPGNVIGMEQRGWLSVRIDKATKDVVEGRVFAWFEDASKSMIVGAFTAKQCNLKP